MLDDQSPTSIHAHLPKITNMATAFEESVWRSTGSKEDYVRVIEARIAQLQAQRAHRQSMVATATATNNTNGGGVVNNSVTQGPPMTRQAPSTPVNGDFEFVIIKVCGLCL